jgi:membrane fusion protein, multidrug efflux system
MKKAIGILALVAVLSSCGEKTKEQQIEELKTELAAKQNAAADLKAEIEKLQNEIDKLGGKSVEKGIPVEVMTVTAAPFKNYLDVMGKVDAEETVSLSSEMPGTVSRIYVKTGDVVSKGTVLAETDNKALMQSISDLQTNMDLVNTLYEKQKGLWDQKIGTEVQFLQIKNQKESLEKKKAALEEQIRMTKIISPIDGTVDAVDIKAGSAIAPGIPAIRVVNLSKLKIKAEVAEKFAPQIKTGNDVRVIIPDMNDSVDTKISYSARTINPLNRTFTVEVNLDGKKEYHPNMFARLKITTYTSSAPVISVPIKVIQRDGTNSYVLVKNGEKAEKKIVTLGQTYNGVAEITSGLKDGDAVISNGHIGLPAGEKVYVATIQ